MSRTKHHRNQKWRHCGEDFWSRRAGMGHSAVCTENKRLTIERERMEQKELIIKELRDNELTPDTALLPMRGFTPEEAEMYSRGLKEFFRPTGRSLFCGRRNLALDT